MFNCLYTVMLELLCPSGYSNTFSGVCAALMIIGGVFGAAASGIFVDRTKLYEETLKIALGLAVIFGLIFLQLTLHTGHSVLLAITCLLFGVLGLATYPIGLELASECTFPVSEATSTGLIVLSGQIQSVIYVFIMKNFARPLQPDRMHAQVCQLNPEDTVNTPKDNTMSIMVSFKNQKDRLITDSFRSSPCSPPSSCSPSSSFSSQSTSVSRRNVETVRPLTRPRNCQTRQRIVSLSQLRALSSLFSSSNKSSNNL